MHVLESLRISYFKMQEQQRLSNRIVQQVSNIPVGTVQTIQTNVSRSTSRVPGHYQFESVTRFNSDFDGDEIDHIG